MFKKILYVIVSVFFGVAIYYINYTSDQTEYKLEIVENAIKNEEYETIPRLFGGVFDKNSIVNDNSDEFDLRVYPGTDRQIVEYEDKDYVDHKYENFENAYYFYLFNASFDMTNITNEKNTVNNASFRFYSGVNKYDYHLNLSKSVNNDIFVNNPKNVSDSVLKGYRNLIEQHDEYSMLHQSFTETMINEIESILGGDIEAYALVDNEGNEIYKQAINLEFENAFFNDVAEMVSKTDKFFKDYDSQSDKKLKEKIVEEYDAFYNEWLKSFNSDEHPDYLFRFTADELVPDDLRFRSIWPLIGYIFGALLLYICLFHNKPIRKFGAYVFSKFKKDSSKKENSLKNNKGNGKEV